MFMNDKKEMTEINMWNDLEKDVNGNGESCESADRSVSKMGKMML